MANVRYKMRITLSKPHLEIFYSTLCGSGYRLPEEKQEEEKPREAPSFVTKPEPVDVCEGEWARFCCRVTGFPRPRVMWILNNRTVVNVSTRISPYQTLFGDHR